MTAIAIRPRGSRVRDWLRAGIASLAVAFTNAGTAIIANRVIQAGTAPKNIGWGTSSTAPAVTDTALGAEAAPTTSGGRTVGTESRVTGTVTNDTYQVVGTVTAVSALAIVEAGLFDNVTAGNMLIRGTHGAYNVVSGDAITYTFQLRNVAAVV